MKMKKKVKQVIDAYSNTKSPLGQWTGTPDDPSDKVPTQDADDL